ncbi:MAG: HAD hydrolase-like protein, partial [Herbaspirillum sp.]
MANKQFDLIVFDWDGTLMDSAATIVGCLQSAARDLGLPTPDPAACSHVIGLGLPEALRLAVPDLAPEHYSRMVERYRYHYLSQDHDLVLFPGVREMLQQLGQAGHFLAVATGMGRVGLNRALNSTGLLTMFDAT